MLDKNNLVQWQLHSPNGHVYPWWVRTLLEEIEHWDLADKKVLEYGGGWSSIWLASKCKEVITIETNEQWIKDIQEYAVANGITNLTLIHRQTNEGDQSKVDYYTEIPEGYVPDIVCIDGVLRHECLLKALTLPRPITIIHDNYQQDGFVCPSSEEVMKPYQIHNFIEEAHTDNHGRKWATAYWNIPA